MSASAEPGGYALDFDGNDFAYAPYHPVLRFTDGFTLEAWVYRRPGGEYWQVVLARDDTRPYGLTVSGDEFLHFELETTRQGIQLNTPVGSVPFNAWVHVAGTWDGGTMRAYVNGQELASAALGGNMVTNDAPFVIGFARADLWREFWNGMIDEVRIWNVVRSATEIRDSSAYPLLGTEAGLVAYWRLDEGSGQSVFSSAGTDIPLQLGEFPEADDRDPAWVPGRIPYYGGAQGSVYLDSGVYGCTGVVGIRVCDSDLVDEASVAVTASSTSGDLETRILDRIPETPSCFTAAMPLAPVPPIFGDGTLQVADAGVVTFTYNDADDGTGQPASATAVARIDCMPSSIGNVRVVNIDRFNATVTFDTDEYAAGSVRYGTSCTSLSLAASGPYSTGPHAIPLTNLEAETQYFFVVDAIDRVGNTSTDDNAGACYSFTSAGSPTPPFHDDFESGTINWPWKVTGTNACNGEVVRNRAHSGYYSLELSSLERHVYSRTEATLTLNLEDYGNVQLRFWAGDFGDDPHGPPPFPFTDGADFDGVAVSEDGVLWYEVQELRSLGENYEYLEFTVDLDSAVGAIGLSYNTKFKIRFNQYDDGPYYMSGIRIDDVSITGDFLPRGVLSLDHEIYQCNSTVNIRLRDSDLIGSASTPVSLAASSGDLETVMLDGVFDGMGSFEGTVSLAAGEVLLGDGLLQASDGDTISARYYDADDGTGNSAMVEATAAVDCRPPVISDVLISHVRQCRPIVHFRTDEPATASLRVGTSCDALSRLIQSASVETSHEIVIRGIMPNQQYYVVVGATDIAGNWSLDTNGGQCYSFITPTWPAPPFFEDFEIGRLTYPWVVTGTGYFRSWVLMGSDPPSGLYSMVMDAAWFTYSRNEVTLNLDMTGAEDAVLTFQGRGYRENSHGPPPSPFIDGADFDGVAVSVDGTTWYEIQPLRNLPNSFNEYTVDVDQALDDVGLAYTNHLEIRFNQYGVEPFPDDGIGIDDILVSATLLRTAELEMDRDVYSCSDTVTVRLRDFDLLGQGNHTLTVTTDGGDAEPLALGEITGGKGEFLGSLPTESGETFPGDGVIQVDHGDTIAVAYEDVETATGPSTLLRDTAAIDCVVPGISGVAVIDLRQTIATVAFNTDELSSATVRFGTSCTNLIRTATSEGLSAQFAIPLDGLDHATDYYFVVEAVDIAGNYSKNDNEGNCYSFTTRPYPSPPFFEGFEARDLRDPWVVTGTHDARARVLSDYGPHSGSIHLVLDDSREDSNYSRNEVTLILNLKGYEDVMLTFWGKSFDDDPHGPPPSPFTGGADFDGVAVSEDGITWYEALALRGLSAEYAEYSIDLDAACEEFGLEYNDTFRVRFNQCGNNEVANDGIGLDDVWITGTPLDELKADPRGDFLLVGAEGGPFTSPLPGYSLVNAGTEDLEWEAESVAGWLTFAPAQGLIPADSTETLSVWTSPGARAMTQGIYSATVEMRNLRSGNSRIRRVTLVVSARHGHTLFFDGARVGFTNPQKVFDFATRNEITVEAEIYCRLAPDHRQYAMAAGTPIWCAFSVPACRSLGFDLAGVATIWSPDQAIPPDTWVHVAGTWDGSVIRSYVNGAEVASRSVAGRVLNRRGGIFVGASDADGSDGWEGMINRVRIWNVVKPGAELVQLARRGIQGSEEGLLLSWEMDESSGQWLYDRSATGTPARLGTSEETTTRDPAWTVRITADIHPLLPITNDDLTCVVRPHPAEIPDVTLHYEWFGESGGALGSAKAAQTVLLATGPLLSHTLTVRDQRINCVLSIEGNYVVDRIQTLPVEIINATPTAPLVHIYPQNPTLGDGLTLIIDQLSSDIDNDDIEYAIRWFRSRDGGISFVFQPGLSGVPPTAIWVPPGYLIEGDIWRGELVPFEAGKPEIEGEIGWDQVYIGPNNRPTITISRPGSQNAVADPTVTIQWEADDADGDAVTVDLYYDTDDIEGGALPIAMEQPASGWMTWQPPGASEAMTSADLSGNGTVTAEDLFILASEWETETEGTRYRIFARAWDEKGAIGEAFSPGEVIVPESIPANTQGLLRLLSAWGRQ